MDPEQSERGQPDPASVGERPAHLWAKIRTHTIYDAIIGFYRCTICGACRHDNDHSVINPCLNTVGEVIAHWLAKRLRDGTPQPDLKYLLGQLAIRRGYQVGDLLVEWQAQQVADRLTGK